MSPADASRPLGGRRVLVTRPRTESDILVRELEAAGAIVVMAPTIRIIPPDDRGPLDKAATEVDRFDWIVFASANAVDAFMNALGDRKRTLPKIAAVGRRTAERLSESEVSVDVVPGEFTAEALVAELIADPTIRGARVLLPRSDIGRQTLADGLRAGGAQVTEVIAYRTVSESSEAEPDVLRMLEGGGLDAVTFTSGSAIRSFVQIHGTKGADLLHHTVVAVIGPVTADVAHELDIPVHVQPTTYSTSEMVEALGEYFRHRPR